MEETRWYQPLNENELLTTLSVTNNLDLALILVYLLISVIEKRPSLLLSFSVSCALFHFSIFDPLTESQLYTLTFAVYSYVVLCNGLNLPQRLACCNILVLCIILGYDAYFYGKEGVYGASKTFVYNNLEHSALCAHIIFICTFIRFKRISNNIKRLLTGLLCMSRNSVAFVVI